MWVAHIPVISARTGVGHDELGGLLLLLGASAFVGMQICGRLIDRWGSRPVTIGAALLLSAVIVTPVLAVDSMSLAAALAAFGFANGCLDVSMNAQAVSVERAYGRPIMSSFHGFFSAGSLVGSGVVAATLWADVGVVPTVACAAVAGVVVVSLAAGSLAGADSGTDGTTGGAKTDQRAAATGSAAPTRWWDGVDRRRLVLLAVVAFALMLAEGTAYDWSALHVVETFGTAEATGAIAFGAFSATMTVARFVIDPVVASVGPVAVLRYGALVGTIGIVVAVLAPVPAIAIAGWAVFGLGLAGLIPQIFTAAGNLSVGNRSVGNPPGGNRSGGDLSGNASGRTISAVVGCGYLGMLAGPAVVGFVSSRTSLNTGLLAAVAALALAVGFAGVVRPADTGPTHHDRGPGGVPH
ncbi:MFS transporter [Gordonia jinghuaiqii]|uniref:MFS transporter n=1 Tax=Gordonia jinghuaiqii TaxID=2758710 RepID=UPI0021D47689|nr:MFS transporter [Gordonia jinghuaiqii]